MDILRSQAKCCKRQHRGDTLTQKKVTNHILGIKRLKWFTPLCAVPHQKRHILAKKANFKKLAIEFAKRKTLCEMHQSLLLQISRPISWQFQGIELHSVKNVLWSPSIPWSKSYLLAHAFKCSVFGCEKSPRLQDFRLYFFESPMAKKITKY